MSVSFDGRAARPRRPRDTLIAKARQRVEELERSVAQMHRLKAKREARRESTVPVEHTLKLLTGQLEGARIQLEYLEGRP